MLKIFKNNPKTTVLTIITVVTSLWDLLSENAELFGVSSKAIMIGSVILTAVAMAYNKIMAVPTEDQEEGN